MSESLEHFLTRWKEHRRGLDFVMMRTNNDHSGHEVEGPAGCRRHYS